MSRRLLLAMSLALSTLASACVAEAEALPPEPGPQPDPQPEPGQNGSETGNDEGLSPFVVGNAVITASNVYAPANQIAFLQCVCREAAKRGLRVAGCADAFVPPPPNLGPDAPATARELFADIYRVAWRRYAGAGPDERAPDDVFIASTLFADELFVFALVFPAGPAT